MYPLLLLLLVATTRPTTYLRRSLASSPYFLRMPFLYFRPETSSQLASWTIPNNLYQQAFLENMQVLYTTTLNSLTSGSSTPGFQINARVTSSWFTGFEICIPDSAVNQNNPPSLWYSVNFLIFLAPNDAPIAAFTLTALMYTTIGNNLFTPTTANYPLTLILPPSFRNNCFYDNAKTTKDRIQVMPSLNQVNIRDPLLVNLTSNENWDYPWDSNTNSLQLNLVVAAYQSQALYVIVNVVALCPNSFIFTNNNMAVSSSPANWFQLPNSNNLITNTLLPLATPLNIDSTLMLAPAITGTYLHHSSFSQLLLSFNLTNAPDPFGTPLAYIAALAYNTLMPGNTYGNYWALGYLGSCPHNLAPHNSTHCFCNPAQNLTFDPLYSTYKCRTLCPPSYYFSYPLAQCVSCQLTHGFLCHSCNHTHCYNCTNGNKYFLKATTVFCLNCTLLFGNSCQDCTDTHCQCKDNFAVSNNGSCQCSNDRFLTTLNSTQTCTLCSTVFSNCANCTQSACTLCLPGYSPTNNSCLCSPPSLTINNSCLTCNSLFGTGCQNCNSLSCLACNPGYRLNNNSCTDCLALFGPHCLDCNPTACLLCTANFTLNGNTCSCPVSTFYLVNSSCRACSDLGCLTCNNSACLTCSPPFVLSSGSCSCPPSTFALANTCTPCSPTFPLCEQCTPTGCLLCTAPALPTNNSCQCPPSYNLLNDTCTPCPHRCTLCTAGLCTSCLPPFALTNGTCLCPVNSLDNGTSCLTCHQLWGNGCDTCDRSQCLTCAGNLTKLNGTCHCPSATALSSGNCLQCDLLFPQCESCTNSSCLLCRSPLLLSNGSCLCAPPYFQDLLGRCQPCRLLFPHCLSCWWDGCLLCQDNYTLTKGTCTCPLPNALVPTPDGETCVLCRDAGSAERCTLTTEAVHYQTGNTLYFKLAYNQPNEEIYFLLNIQYNIEVLINNYSIPFTYSHLHSLFTVSLAHLNEIRHSLANITVTEPTYIQFNGIALQNQPPPFNVTPIPPFAIQHSTLTLLFQIKNYISIGLLTLSLSVFNRLFEQTNLIALLSFTGQATPNSLGNVLDLLNKQSPLTPIPLKLPFEERHLPSDLGSTIYSLNQPLWVLILQPLCLWVFGLLLWTYTTNYLKTKRHARRHLAFRNILTHSSQYSLQNCLCVLSTLAFPSLLQLKLLLQIGTNTLGLADGINLVIAVSLLALLLCTLALYLNKFPRTATYSVLYLQMDSSKALTLILTLVSLLQQLLSASIVLLLPLPTNQYFLLTLSFLHLLLLVVCGPYNRSKWSYLLLLTKTALAALVNMVFLFGEDENAILTATAYAVVAVVCIQIVEVAFKVGRLVLRNKGVIEDRLQTSDSHQDIHEEAPVNEEQKRLAQRVLQLLSQAKMELREVSENFLNRHRD